MKLCIHLPALWVCACNRSMGKPMLVACFMYQFLVMLGASAGSGGQWVDTPLFICCISLGNLGNFCGVYFICAKVCICVWYISYRYSAWRSLLFVWKLFLFFHTFQCTGFFPLLFSYLKKNTELQIAFRIDCGGMVILFSVNVIIFNS